MGSFSKTNPFWRQIKVAILGVSEDLGISGRWRYQVAAFGVVGAPWFLERLLVSWEMLAANNSGVCHGSTACGVSSDSAPSDSARQVPQFCGIPSHDGTQHDRLEEGRRPE